MRRSSYVFMIFSLAAAPRLMAQVPGPMAGAPFGAPAVEMLLSHTGALQLTDAQVVRLAAIARRTEDRHRALRTRLDSLRPRRAPGDSAGRRERSAPPTDLFDREREASHVDLRDALAVLTADQQARAWEMMAMRRVMPFPGADGARGTRGRDGGPGGRDGGRGPDGRRASPQPGRPGEPIDR
jgi:hypothetical protein